MKSTTEATAPTRIDLAGGLLDLVPPALLPAGAVAVSVAIDRRPFCRVEAADGVRLESKDSLTRAEGPDVASLLGPGTLGLVAHVLQAVGVVTGVKVAVQARVPADAGLAASTATAVAVAAAAARTLGRDLEPAALAAVVGEAEGRARGRPASRKDPWMALRGGVTAIHLEPDGVRALPLATDPGRVEESLLLVDTGGARAGLDEGALVERLGSDVLAAVASAAAGLRDALISHRYEDVPGLIDREWEARKRLGPGMTSAEIDLIVEAARSFGGAAWACGTGGGGMAAVWCGPGRRPALEQALTAAGFRPMGIRLDLRGLEIE